ncbi:hypothetical protein [Psychrobacter immobilis]|uniref:hypothetical protein n=1 Tax=Psychrobacter immobilis TaxID=498 RepID=UPI003FD40A2C
MREAHPTKYTQIARSLRKKKDVLTWSFSRDYSGILLTTMAMQSVAERSIETTGMRSDTVDCTPAARQIQAVGGIGYSTFILLNKTLWLYRYNRNKE